MRASVAAKRANPIRRKSNWDDELRQQLNRRDVELILSMRVEDVGEAVEDADAVGRFLRFRIEYGHPVLRGDERPEKLQIRHRASHVSPEDGGPLSSRGPAHSLRTAPRLPRPGLVA